MVEPFLEEAKGHFYVGVVAGDYRGPVADIYAKGDWFYVNTDDYEGCAMMNIEALPTLIDALQKLQSALSRTDTKEG